VIDKCTEGCSHFLNLLQEVELVLEDVLKAGSCIQGMVAWCLGHSNAELWVMGEVDAVIVIVLGKLVVRRRVPVN